MEDVNDLKNELSDLKDILISRMTDIKDRYGVTVYVSNEWDHLTKLSDGLWSLKVNVEANITA